jgi:hypothetical protein
MVVNVGQNIALAINWEQVSSPNIPKDYRYCTKTCGGPWAPTAETFRLQEACNEDKPTNAGKKRIAEEALTAQCLKKPKTTLEEFFGDLTKAETVLAFMALAPTSRPNNSIPRTRVESVEDWAKKAAHLFASYLDHSNRSTLMKLQAWFDAIEVVDVVAHQTTLAGLSYATPQILDPILKEAGQSATDAERRRFQRQLRFPRKLRKILGEHLGVLAFIAVHERSAASLEDLKPDEYSSFQGLLARDAQEMIKIGGELQRVLCKGAVFPTMLWEKISQSELEALSADQLRGLLPIRHLAENAYDPPDWEKPDGWPGQWPAGPDSVFDGEQCEICQEANCECIRTCFAHQPSVTSYPERGLGVRAGVAYEEGQRIGEIVGRIVAPDRHADGYGLYLIRSDIHGEPIVGQIYTKEEGNILRFVNHRCWNPSATCRGMKISGKYRMVVVAKRKISAGEEITINCGKAFLKQACLCGSTEACVPSKRQ